QVADGEHDAVGPQTRTAGKREPLRSDVDPLAAEAQQRGARCRRLLALAEEGFEVLAVDEAWDERRRFGRGIVPRSDESQKMLGVARESAQARGRYVQQVAREARAVGRAASHAIAALDQDDAHSAA